MSKIEIIRRPTEEDWARCYRLALGTEGNGTDKVPTPAWMEKILKAEHSPIRTLMWTVRMYDVPYWVAMHLVRHKYGVEWYVQSQRNDRQKRYDRNKARQDAPVMLTMDANAQALINISRKRLCYKAATETRQLWTAVCNAIIGLNPEMLRVLVPDCVYRGKCREMQPCGERDGR